MPNFLMYLEILVILHSLWCPYLKTFYITRFCITRYIISVGIYEMLMTVPLTVVNCSTYIFQSVLRRLFYQIYLLLFYYFNLSRYLDKCKIKLFMTYIDKSIVQRQKNISELCLSTNYLDD